MWPLVVMAGIKALGPAMTAGGSPVSGLSNSGFFGMGNEGWTVNFGAPGAVQSGATKTGSGMGFGASASGVNWELIALIGIGAYFLMGK